MKRLLGIDYGAKRIGVATADDETRVAVPLEIVAGRNEPTRDARVVADLGARESADAFVVGLPLSMDDSDSDQTRLTRRFIDELTRLSGKPVFAQDERLSTDAAQDMLAETGPASRRQRADAVAAQLILQAYLDNAPPPQKS